MVQPTHDRKSDHLVSCILSGRNRSALLRDLLGNPLMGSCLVEVHHICIEDALELPLLQDQQVVQTFLPHTPQEALADRIGSGSMIRCFEHLNRTGCRYTSEAGPKFAIVITNQILGCLAIRGGFPELLSHPGIGRGSCDAHMDHFPRLQFYAEERKERPKEKVSHLQEVTGPDIRRVIAEKRAPLLTSWLVGANRPHVLLDGALTHVYPQFQQFPANALSSPELIFLRHLPNQRDGLWGDLRRMRSSF